MRPIVAALLLAPALAACGSAVMSRKADADQQAKAAYARCEARRAAHQLPTYLAAVDCAAPTVTGAYKEAAYPFEDLLYVSIQARRIGATHVDRGEISEADEQRDVATLDDRITAEEDRRFAIMRRGGNPTPTAPDVLVQGLASLTPAPIQAETPVPPPGSAANCFTLGGQQHCK